MKTNFKLVPGKLCPLHPVTHKRIIYAPHARTSILLIAILLCSAAKGHSQTSYATEFIPGKVYIDSRLPDISLGSIIRYKDTSAKLDDFFNKIIVFDFWFTHCTDCIAQFPKEDSLQKEFEDDIQIIPVTYESKETVSAFLTKWEKIHHIKLSLPFIVGDSSLDRYFANPYDPHYAWIGQDKRVLAITSEGFMTESNIRGLLRETAQTKQSLTADSTQLHFNRMDEKELNNYYHIKTAAQ